MPDENAVYKAGTVAHKAANATIGTFSDINYTASSVYSVLDMDKSAKRIPHMKCKTCGNIFAISDDLFDEDHCTFECKYNKSKSKNDSE